MAKRESNNNGPRMYSDSLKEESSGAKKQIEYYKKVEKTLTRTVIKDGNNPTSKKVVSTTIIKNGNKPEQVSKKVYTSSNNQGSRRFEQNSQKIEPRKFKTGTSSSQYTKKVESSSNSKYTGLKPSSQTVNTSNKYSSRTTNQISKKAISTTNTYLANKSKAYPSQNYGTGVKETRSQSTGNKEKFTYAGTVKEKENYMYYVSGVGYVTKEGAKKAEEEKAKSKPKPQPIMRSERTTIRIVMKKPERKTGEKVENYEYRESKRVIDSKMDSIVVHKRGDPFYQIIGGKKKFSSYTSGARGKNRIDDDLSKDKISTLKTDKYKTKTENKYKSTSTNKYQTKTQSVTSAKESQSQSSTKDKKKVPSKYTSTYQKTTKVEVSRKKYEPKGKYEKNFTEGNRGAKGGMRNKNLPPSTKKYEEKTEDTYKKGKGPYNPNLNQKMFDTEKYKKTKDEEQENKDGLNAPDRYPRPYEENQGMDDPNYCPIHGLKGHQNLGGEGEIERREENNQGVNPEDADNYRFYESQRVTRKVENINTENTQNIESEQNLNANTVGQEQFMASKVGMDLSQKMEGMSQQIQQMSQQMQRLSQQSQGLYGMQGIGVAGSQGCDISKVYIATRAVPVYSEIVNQFSNMNDSQVCNVCGNPFNQGLINNTQEIMYNNNGCPIHGQTMVQQQQFNGY